MEIGNSKKLFINIRFLVIPNSLIDSCDRKEYNFAQLIEKLLFHPRYRKKIACIKRF